MPTTTKLGAVVARMKCGEDVMKDFKADWRKWRRVERAAAVLIALAWSAAVPTLLVLATG
jgi:hypothetical protein